MNVLLENALAIAAVGSLAAVLALVVFLSRRDAASLAALAAAAGLTLALLALEGWVKTDREQVEAAIGEVLEALEANDVAGVLQHIDPAAVRLRADVEALMPEIKVRQANSIGRVEVTVDDSPEPPRADARILAFLDGVHQRSGMRVAYFKQRVDLVWVKRDGRWLVADYTAYYDGQPIDAASSAAGNRPVPR
jgi:hypothetical protein